MKAAPQKGMKSPTAVSLKSFRILKAAESPLQTSKSARVKTTKSLHGGPKVTAKNIKQTPISLEAINQVEYQGNAEMIPPNKVSKILKPCGNFTSLHQELRPKMQINVNGKSPTVSQQKKKELLKGIKSQMNVSEIQTRSPNQIQDKGWKIIVKKPQFPINPNSIGLTKHVKHIQSTTSLKTSFIHEQARQNYSEFSIDGQKQNHLSGPSMKKSAIFGVQSPKTVKKIFPIVQKMNRMEQNEQRSEKFSLKHHSIVHSNSLNTLSQFGFEKHHRKISDASHYSNQAIEINNNSVTYSNVVNMLSQSRVEKKRSLPSQLSLKSIERRRDQFHVDINMKKSMFIEAPIYQELKFDQSRPLTKNFSHPIIINKHNLVDQMKKSMFLENQFPDSKSEKKIPTLGPKLENRTPVSLNPHERKPVVKNTQKKLTITQKHPVIALKPKPSDKKEVVSVKLMSDNVKSLKAKPKIEISKKLEVLGKRKEQKLAQNANITSTPMIRAKFNDVPDKKIPISPRMGKNNQILETKKKAIVALKTKNKNNNLQIAIPSSPHSSDNSSSKKYFSSINNCKQYQEISRMNCSLSVIEEKPIRSPRQCLDESPLALAGLERKEEMILHEKNHGYHNGTKFMKKNEHYTANTASKPAQKPRRMSEPSILQTPPYFTYEPKSIKMMDQTFSTKASHRTTPLRISDFIRGPEIGRGKFGLVNLAIHRKTGLIFALKSIKKTIVREQKIIDQMIREIKIQYSMDHPNLVKLYGIFDDKDHIYLILQLCPDGQLYKLLQKKHKFQEIDTCFIMKELSEGISELHKHQVIHRDMKPENVVISFGISKICDFGWSIQNNGKMRETLCGTPLYFSPELLTEGSYNEKADLWALGIMAFEMITGSTPFDINSTSELMKIAHSQIRYPGSMSLEARDFIGMLLQRNPEMRVSITDVLKHRFFKIFQDQGEEGRSKSAVRLITRR